MCDVDLVFFYLKGNTYSARTNIGILGRKKGKQEIRKDEKTPDNLKRSCDGDAFGDWIKSE